MRFVLIGPLRLRLEGCPSALPPTTHTAVAHVLPCFPQFISVGMSSDPASHLKPSSSASAADSLPRGSHPAPPPAAVASVPVSDTVTIDSGQKRAAPTSRTPARATTSFASSGHSVPRTLAFYPAAPGASAGGAAAAADNTPPPAPTSTPATMTTAATALPAPGPVADMGWTKATLASPAKRRGRRNSLGSSSTGMGGGGGATRGGDGGPGSDHYDGGLTDSDDDDDEDEDDDGGEGEGGQREGQRGMPSSKRTAPSSATLRPRLPTMGKDDLTTVLPPSSAAAAAAAAADEGPSFQFLIEQFASLGLPQSTAAPTTAAAAGAGGGGGGFGAAPAFASGGGFAAAGGMGAGLGGAFPGTAAATNITTTMGNGAGMGMSNGIGMGNGMGMGMGIDANGMDAPETCPICSASFPLTEFATHVYSCIRLLDDGERRQNEDLDRK